MNKIRMCWLFFVLLCFFGASVSMVQATEEITLPVISDNTSSSESEDVFRVFSPLDLMDKESSQSVTPPLEFSLQDDLNLPVPPPLDTIDPESARIDAFAIEAPSEIDPALLQHGFSTSDTQTEEKEETMPKRSPGHWLASSSALVVLMILMVLAFLYYIATTDGKWPVSIPSDDSSKRRKKTKK